MHAELTPTTVLPMGHPAKYNDRFIPIFAQWVQPATSILDPFGGTGKIFLLHDYLPYQARIEALEIEPEWCAYDMRTTQGSILTPPWNPCTFDAVVTSPTYGNRMADKFKASKPRRRYTYTHKLGRSLHPENSGGMQWGPVYREFHLNAWRIIKDLLRSGGLLILNMADHIRNRQRQHVTRWHVETLCSLGFVVVRGLRVATEGLRDGQNRDSRLGYEYIIKFVKRV